MSCSDLFRRSLAALFACLLLLTGCAGDPSSAFQHERPFSNPLLQPGLRGGINVAPIEVLSPMITDGGRDLAAAVAAALRDSEIAALEAPPANGRYALLGRVDRRSNAAARVIVDWTLVDDKGEAVRQFVTERAGPGDAWIKATAGDVVAALNRYVMDVEGLPPPPEEMPKLTIVGIDGAPGAGGRALASALEYHLKKAGLEISDTVDDHGALILGKVTLTPSKVPGAAAVADTLTVSWTVLRPNGSEMGNIEQANDVPKGTLDKPWGDLAYIIAEGAAEGIVDLLRRTTVHSDSGVGRDTVAARTGGRKPGL